MMLNVIANYITNLVCPVPLKRSVGRRFSLFFPERLRSPFIRYYSRRIAMHKEFNRREYQVETSAESQRERTDTEISRSRSGKSRDVCLHKTTCYGFVASTASSVDRADWTCTSYFRFNLNLNVFAKPTVLYGKRTRFPLIKRSGWWWRNSISKCNWKRKSISSIIWKIEWVTNCSVQQHQR